MTCKVDIPKVLDLRDSTTHTALSLTDAQLFSEVDDYTACQAIEAAAHQLGHAGSEAVERSASHMKVTTLTSRGRWVGARQAAVLSALGAA